MEHVSLASPAMGRLSSCWALLLSEGVRVPHFDLSVVFNWVFCLQIIYTSLWLLISKISAAAAAAKSLQLCPTLCNPIVGSPTGSLDPGILQARILEWVAICFSNAWKWKVKVKSLSRVWLLTTPWTAAYQAPPSMGFSRQEYWSGVPLTNDFKTLKILLH